MNKTLAFLGLLSIFVFGVNGCGRPCSSGCGEGQCCNSCCPADACSIQDKDGNIIVEPNTCGPCEDKPVACPEDAKLCPDGSYVVREGPDCAFAPCVGDTCYDCDADYNCACGVCPDGINQFGCCGRCQYKKNGAGDLECSGILECPKCVPKIGICPLIYDPRCCDGTDYSNQCFANNACATNCVKGECQVACTKDAKLCPDGSAVGRVSPDCEFAPCPECIEQDGYCLDKKGKCVKGALVNCYQDPCYATTNGGCKANEQCVANYCNGCNVICKKK